MTLGKGENQPTVTARSEATKQSAFLENSDCPSPPDRSWTDGSRAGDRTGFRLLRPDRRGRGSQWLGSVVLHQPAKRVQIARLCPTSL